MHRVLVVENEADCRFRHRLVLQSEGFEVATASGSVEALQLVPEWEPEAVVLDVNLGGENGLDLLRRIAELRPSIRTVLLNAHLGYEDDFTSWLADLLLGRQVNGRELASAVRRLLSERSSVR